MPDKAKYKLGLALGCGGVKGVAHIGVLRCLRDNGIMPDCIAGTSMGALIGALYAYTGDVEEVASLFHSLTNLRHGARMIDFATRGGMIKGGKIQAFLESFLHGATFDQLPVPLTVLATDLNSCEPVLLDSGPVAKAVRASISAAPVFQPIEYGGRVLSDGALSNPVPADVVRAMGAKYVIAVNLTNGYYDQRIGPEVRLDSIGNRSIAALECSLARFTTRAADVVLEPAIDNQSILGLEALFDSQGLHKYIQAGHDAAQVQLAAIQRGLA